MTWDTLHPMTPMGWRCHQEDRYHCRTMKPRRGTIPIPWRCRRWLQQRHLDLQGKHQGDTRENISVHQLVASQSGYCISKLVPTYGANFRWLIAKDWFVALDQANNLQDGQWCSIWRPSVDHLVTLSRVGSMVQCQSFGVVVTQPMIGIKNGKQHR